MLFYPFQKINYSRSPMETKFASQLPNVMSSKVIARNDAQFN